MVVSLEIGNFAVHIFDLHSGRLIQIPLELLPLDQRPISVHNIEIFVGILVDQHTQLNTEFIQAYEEKYRALLQLTGSTFETIAIETQRQADSMLSFGKVRNRK